MSFDRYDIRESYQWNYDQADRLVLPNSNPQPIPGDWRIGSMRLDSPLGLGAGPLLNGNWCLYYAGLGFDWITYKTVRSRSRSCYPLPNLVPIQGDEELERAGVSVKSGDSMKHSWAVSFGMPSKQPSDWMSDVRHCRNVLPAHVKLSVSVVASVQEGWSLEDIADDYAWCAAQAVASGADAVEANFSCPNVSTCDGQLYQDPMKSAQVAKRIRDSIPGTPLLLKIGFLAPEVDCRPWIDELTPCADALVMTNSVSAYVEEASTDLLSSKRLFGGELRGICGRAIRDASLGQVQRFAKAKTESNSALSLVGVGGISNLVDVQDYIQAGADSIQIATAAMLNPLVGQQIKSEWIRSI